MFFFSGLVFFYGLFWIIGKAFHLSAWNSYAMPGTLAAASMFILVGISHFLKPGKLEAMIPDRLQAYARLLNYGSGAVEIILGCVLLLADFRIAASWGLIALLIAIFPANINVASKKPNAYNISRLFFQPVYIFWVWFFCMR